MNFHEKVSYTFRDIDKLISAKAEENLNLEFKGSKALDFIGKDGEEKKKELTRDVSAMANSNGGVIIYGLVEVDHVASSIDFIDGNIVTKEKLEQILQTGISRPITANQLKIIPIRKNKSIANTIYIIQIKESDNSPHMAKDSRFYKRNNFNRIFCMEYEIRKEYLRLKKSILEVNYPIVQRHNDGMPKNMNPRLGHMILFFMIKNVGSILEANFKVLIEIPISIYVIEHGVVNPIGKFRLEKTKTYYTFSIQGVETIFPEENYKMFNFYIKGEKENLNDKIRYTLFYGGGIIKQELSLNDIFDEKLRQKGL